MQNLTNQGEGIVETMKGDNILRKEKIETTELLPPQKLKTLLIDVENKKFLLNGKEFGKKCEHITITCSPPSWKIQVIINRPIEFTTEYNLQGDKNSKVSLCEIVSIK